MDKKAEPTHMLHTRDPSQDKRPTQTESEGLNKFSKQTDRGKKARVATLVSDKIDFKRRTIKTDPEVTS